MPEIKQPVDVRARVLAGKGNRVRPVADEVGIAPTTLYAQIERGEVKAYSVGKSVIIPASEAARLLGIDIEKAA